jgi:hypothetical protein
MGDGRLDIVLQTGASFHNDLSPLHRNEGNNMAQPQNERHHDFVSRCKHSGYRPLSVEVTCGRKNEHLCYQMQQVALYPIPPPLMQHDREAIPADAGVTATLVCH